MLLTVVGLRMKGLVPLTWLANELSTGKLTGMLRPKPDVADFGLFGSVTATDA
jgi:hypothetical protein